MIPQRLGPFTIRSRNLVRFARHLPIETLDEAFAGDFAFRDAGSRFSILKSPKTAPGPDECFGLFARDARVVFDKLLGMQLIYDGLDDARQARLTPYNSMNYFRSHVVEHFCQNGIEPMPPIEGECVMWFAAADVLCVRYCLTNKSDVDVPVRLTWFSESAPPPGAPPQRIELEPIARGFRAGLPHVVGPIHYTSRAELIGADGDLRFIINDGRARSEPVARVIPAHGECICRFVVRLAFNDEPLPDVPTDVWTDAGLDAAIASTEAAYARLPALAPSVCGHLDLTLKAAGVLRSLRYRDFDEGGEARMTIHAGKTGCGATWFWDTAATLPGLGLMRERDAAEGALRLLLRGITENGQPPVTYENRRYGYGGHQMPILAWGAGHFLAACPNRALLEAAFEPLSRYVRHWLENFSTPWGLVRHPPGFSSLDDTLRWHSGFPLVPRPGQAWTEQRWGRMQPGHFASPDINAFLVLEMRTLAAMARHLGRPEETATWLERADILGQAINQWLIEPQSGVYQDRHLESGAFNGMVHMGSFIPAYAGLAPPAVLGRCGEYLLSPEHFLTTLPFPVVARSHPTFRSGGFLHRPAQSPGSLVQQSYWRGRTWIHADVWLLGCLWRAGLQNEADDIADQILTAVGRGEGICECYDSLTGFGNGHPEFMWSAAAVLMLAHRFYRRDPVAELSPMNVLAPDRPANPS